MGEEAEKFAELQQKLVAEIDVNHMKRLILGMVDNRLGALEAHSAEMVKLQSSSLESLRQLHLAAASGSPAPTMHATERERLIKEFIKSLD